MKRVYLDHSATTPVHPEVAAIAVEYMVDKFGNASSVHSYGREARIAVDQARSQLASLINAEPREILFTSGGTEADNLAIKGLAYANKARGNHIITTKIEHHAVLHVCEYLAKHGFDITYLPVDADGLVSVAAIEAAITDQTILISVMFANNEVGTIQPIAEIGALARRRGIYFHTDAVQAVGNYPLDVKELKVDLLSLSGHKFYAPKGIGALFVRKGVRLEPLQQGGSHERNLRAGTENVPAIVAIGRAAAIAEQEMTTRIERITALRDRLMQGIEQTISHVKLNGHRDKRMPNNVNFSIKFIEGEALLLSLDMKGIASSSGSACTSGSLDPSHVLLAMGLSHEVAHGSLRLTLGRENNESDIDYVLTELPIIVDRLRSMSPLWGESTQISAKNPCFECKQ